MPITFVTFAAGYLAIIGFPFFSGFYAKDHDHRGRLRAAVLSSAAWRMFGAGITGVLHDPAHADDLLRRQTLAAGRASARVATGHDCALDLVGNSLGSSAE